MRTTLQDLVKTALAGVSQAKLAEEASKDDKKKCSKCGKESCKGDCSDKTAEAKYIGGLSDALLFLSDNLDKVAEMPAPGTGPGALEVEPTQNVAPYPTSMGRAVHQPQNPGLQSATGSASPTLLADNMEQSVSPMKLAQRNMARLGLKTAGDDAAAHGEDGNLSSRPNLGAPTGMDSAQSIGGFGGNSGLIGSNEAAINYKKDQALAPQKAELARYLTEPAMSGVHDSTLSHAFDSTIAAGAKLASDVKVAAGRALLMKIAEDGARSDASPEMREKRASLIAAINRQMPPTAQMRPVRA